MTEKIEKILELPYCNKYSVPSRYCVNILGIQLYSIFDETKADFFKNVIGMVFCATPFITYVNSGTTINNQVVYDIHKCENHYFCFASKEITIDDIRLHCIMWANEINPYD